jgi:hypothetical protein
MGSKLPPAKDWRARDIKDWNAVTFHEYLKEAHKKRYGTSYVAKNMGIQNKNIKRMYDEYGKEVTKKFIDLCFIHYKPTGRYAGANFMFFYSYLKDRYLPMAEIEVRKEKEREIRKEQRTKVKQDIQSIIDKF